MQRIKYIEYPLSILAAALFAVIQQKKRNWEKYSENVEVRRKNRRISKCYFDKRQQLEYGCRIAVGDKLGFLIFPCKVENNGIYHCFRAPVALLSRICYQKQQGQFKAEFDFIKMNNMNCKQTQKSVVIMLSRQLARKPPLNAKANAKWEMTAKTAKREKYFFRFRV